MALVYDLKLEQDEVETGKRLMAAILKIYKTGKWNKTEIEYHFTEWKRIAGRIKRGTEMLDTMNPMRKESKEHAEKLEGLYTYLMKMLGVYDALFKHMFRNNEDSYLRARDTVLIEIK